MIRLVRRLALGPLAAACVIASAASAGAQAAKPTPPGPAAPAAAPAPDRFRLVLNAAFWPSKTSFSDTRTFPEYAEETTIHSSYDTGTGKGFDGALQVSLYQGLGLLFGYSRQTRDVTGTVDVSRPNPLYLNQPRTATASLSGYGYTEGAIDTDVAYARAAGHLDWALFAGATFFQVEADMLQTPTYDEKYPYDTLTIASTPSTKIKGSPVGMNVGGRLDYRFGSSRRVGIGAQVRYSKASAKLKATPDATEASVDAGGLSVGGGLRFYF
ncbi:MAG TPA: hypothetical protein VMT70_09640 [Vicinamibacteria bacterium]|nr:hypothetical protein [Vicinamibacteria bacterium]